MTSVFLANLLGAAATLLQVSSYLHRRRGSILLWQIAGAFLWVGHYYYLGAGPGMMMNLLGASRQCVFFFRGRHPAADWTGWPWVFATLFLIGGIISWDNPFTILPIVAMILSTFAFWQIQTANLRILAMLSPPLWLVYNLAAGSLPGVITELATMTGQVVGYIRNETPGAKPADPLKRTPTE